MEKQFDNTNRGVIFKNDNKGTNEKAPDYRGKINVDGKDKEISLWIRKSNDGLKTFFSASISEPFVKTETPKANIVEDDLPF